MLDHCCPAFISLLYELMTIHCPLGAGLAAWYRFRILCFRCHSVQHIYNFHCDFFFSPIVYCLISTQLKFSSLPLIIDFKIDSTVIRK